MLIPEKTIAACLCVACSFAAFSHAARNDWAEGTQERADGATRDYYNRAGLLKWDHYMGDWVDADNVPQGDRPLATATVVDDDTTKWVEFDVTGLVRQWLDGTVPNQGVFLRGVEGSGKYDFRSREFSDQASRPQLVIRIGGKSVTLHPAADTYLEPSTYRSQGDSQTLRIVSEANHALLRFDLGELQKRASIESAKLRLHCFAQYGQSMEIGVFRCAQGQAPDSSQRTLGLASKYSKDEGLEDDPNVVFFADFESEDWADAWTVVAGNLDPVDADPQREFEPFQGKGLRVKIAEGTTTAMNVTYKFEKEIGYEPEEIFFRYYLRFGNDWKQTVQGGKMPGISGTYGKTGWGGRRSRGLKGWSARGSFYYSIPPDNPLGGTNPIGTYCYHADMQGSYGDIWLWQRGYRGYLENNRWYSVEQYLKMNTPGEKNGVLRAWVDGYLAFEKTDIRFRHEPTLKIEQIWMNVYHGGTIPSPYDQHLFVDNVVIAKKYIGPQ